jgi:hypothetical protein
MNEEIGLGKVSAPQAKLVVFKIGIFGHFSARI